MKEGLNILTDSQKKIQAEIDAIKKKIKDIEPSIAKESKDVKDDNDLIKAYGDQLKLLQDKLNNVINTQQSTYDSIKGQIADKKKLIETCDLINKPKTIKDDLDATQNESSLQEKLKKIKSDVAKLIDEMAPYEVKTGLFKADIIALEREIEKINKKMIELNKIKESNMLQIEELNKIIKVLDRTILELETKIYSNVVVNNENLLNVSEDMDTSLNYLFTNLKKQSLSSDVIYDKIDHRDREHEHLYNRNKIFDILFYCFYCSFLLIMICTQNIQREYFLIYLFVGLIPFIYPFVFKWILYLIKYLSTDIHGPKNAFVDINNTLIAYNDL
jgi:chromosome segregation ATPase